MKNNKVYYLLIFLLVAIGSIKALAGEQRLVSFVVAAGNEYFVPSPAYLFAFQGQEKDRETGLEAFELRLWEGRLGRWMTTDPYGQYASPYLGMGNNPVNGTDPDGGFWQELGNWFRGNGWQTNEAVEFGKNHPDWIWDSKANRYYTGTPNDFPIADGINLDGSAVSPTFGPIKDLFPWSSDGGYSGNFGDWLLDGGPVIHEYHYGGIAPAPGFAKGVNAAMTAKTFFEGAKYSPKVLNQMSKADDILHAFPKSVDGFATKFGKVSTKIGGDGKTYQLLEMSGSYGGKTGTFEFIKDANGLINHRFLRVH